MKIEQLSNAAQDCLKAIWQSTEWFDSPVTTTRLASRLGIAPSTVSEMVKRLADQELVIHEPYSTVELSELGRDLALTMVRRHRLLEAFLVTQLGYSWDEVHDEAEVLEHAVSDRLIDRIDVALGHPAFDPHGDPIPTAEGIVNELTVSNLSQLKEGDVATVIRISDADPEMLRYFASVGLTLDAALTVVERRDYAGVIRVRTPGTTDDLHLGEPAQRSVWVRS